MSAPSPGYSITVRADAPRLDARDVECSTDADIACGEASAEPMTPARFELVATSP